MTDPLQCGTDGVHGPPVLARGRMGPLEAFRRTSSAGSPPWRWRLQPKTPEHRHLGWNVTVVGIGTTTETVGGRLITGGGTTA